MDQVKIGKLLKQLRKEKKLTQEELAAKFNVTNRSISRWENGINMPDLSLLIELAEFYEVSVDEIIQGEQNATPATDSNRTVKALAEYTVYGNRRSKERVMGIITMACGGIVALLALILFPAESSWNGIYTIFGSCILIFGFYLITRVGKPSLKYSIVTTLAIASMLFTILFTADYVAVKTMHQIPRFAYRVTYDSRFPHSLRYDSLFYSAIRSNIGSGEETVRIIH